MAEVTSEMGAELRASAMAAGTSVAAEVGRRLERLARLETEDSGDLMRVDWLGLRVATSNEIGFEHIDPFRKLEAK